MKQFNGLRALFSIFAIVMVFTLINLAPAHAQGGNASPTPKSSPVPSPTPYKKPLTKTKEERDAFRNKIHEVLDMMTDATNTITPETADSFSNSKSSSQKRLATAKNKLDAVKDEDLETLMEGINPAELEMELAEAKAKIEKIRPTMAAAWGQLAAQPTEYGDDKTTNRYVSKASNLPPVGGPDQICAALIGSGHAGDEVVLAAKAALLVTKIINIASDRACGQVVVAGVVVLGNGGVGGGNPSLACIVSDGLLFAAEQLVDKITSCDNEFTARSVDAAVARMATVHGDIAKIETDLASSVLNDNNNKNSIITNNGTNKDLIVANSDTNKGLITVNSNTNKDLIIGEIGAGTVVVTGAVSDGTQTLVTAGNNHKNTIVGNDNANKGLIIANDDANKTFLLRLQIEADLSSTDSATFVAMFLTPKTVCVPVLNDQGEPIAGTNQCGYLDFARAIVAQTVANLAGSNASTANAFLAKGDAFRAAKDYKQAYQNYRLAYKTAAGISTK